MDISGYRLTKAEGKGAKDFRGEDRGIEESFGRRSEASNGGEVFSTGPPLVLMTASEKDRIRMQG